MANKTITMMVRQGNSQVSITDTLSDTSTWQAQAYLFHKFLVAQGYYLDSEDVGADVSSYVHAEVSEEY